MAKKKATPKEKKLSPESEASLNDTLKEDNSGTESKNAGAAAGVSVIEAVTEPNPAKAAEEIKPESPTPVKEKITGDSGASTEEVKSAADNIATIEESAPTEGAPIDDNKVFVHLNNNSNMQNQPIKTWPPISMLTGCIPTTAPQLCINNTVTIQTGCQPPCVNTTVDSRPGDWTTIFGKCPTMHPGCGPAQQLPQSIGCVVTHNATCPPVTNYHTCHPCHTAAIGCPNTSTCAANANNTDTLISRMPCPTAIPACHHSGHHHCHHTRHHHCNHTHLIGCPNTSTCSPNANADTILSKMPCPSMDCQTRPGVCVSLPTNCPTVTTCEHTWNCGGGVSRPTICPTVCDCPVTWNCQKSEVLSCNPCPTVQTCGPVSAHPCPSTADCNANAMASAYPCPTVATCPPTWNCPKSEVLSCHPCPSIPCPTMPGHCYSVPTNCPTVTTCEHTWNCDSKAFSCNPCPTVQPCQTLNSPGGNNAGGGVSLPTICPTVCACPHTWNCESKMFSCHPCPSVPCPTMPGHCVSIPTNCPTVTTCEHTWNCDSKAFSCNPCPTVQHCPPPTLDCPGGNNDGGGVSLPTICPTVCTCPPTWNCESKMFSCNPCPTVATCPPSWNCGGNNAGGGVSLPTICPTVCACPPTWNCPKSEVLSCYPCPSVPCPTMPGHCFSVPTNCPTVTTCEHTWNCGGANNANGIVSVPTNCPTVTNCHPTWNCASHAISCNPCPSVQPCGPLSHNPCPTVQPCHRTWIDCTIINCPFSHNPCPTVQPCYPSKIECTIFPCGNPSIAEICTADINIQHTIGHTCPAVNANAGGMMSANPCPTVQPCHPVSANPCPTVQTCGQISHNPCPTVQICGPVTAPPCNINSHLVICPPSHLVMCPPSHLVICPPSHFVICPPQSDFVKCQNSGIACFTTNVNTIDTVVNPIGLQANANAASPTTTVLTDRTIGGCLASAYPCGNTNIPGCGGEATWLTGMHNCHSRFCSEIGCPVSVHPCPSVVCSKVGCPVSVHPCPSVATCYDNKTIINTITDCYTGPTMCPPSVGCPPQANANANYSGFATICSRINCPISAYPCQPISANPCPTVQACGNAEAQKQPIYGPTGWHTCTIVSANPCPSTHGCESVQVCPTIYTQINCPIGVTGWYTCTPVSQHPCPSTHECPSVQVICPTTHTQINCPIGYTGWYTCVQVSHQPCPSTHGCPTVEPCITTAPPQANANANYSGIATVCTQLGCPPGYTGWHTCTIVSANPCPSTHECPSVQVICPTTHTQINCPIGYTGWYTCVQVSHQPCPSTHGCPTVEPCITTAPQQANANAIHSGAATVCTQHGCPIGITGWYTCGQVSHQPCPSTQGCDSVQVCSTTHTQIECPVGPTGMENCKTAPVQHSGPETVCTLTPGCHVSKMGCGFSHASCETIEGCHPTAIDCNPHGTGMHTADICMTEFMCHTIHICEMETTVLSVVPCPSVADCPSIADCPTIGDCGGGENPAEKAE